MTASQSQWNLVNRNTRWQEAYLAQPLLSVRFDIVAAQAGQPRVSLCGNLKSSASAPKGDLKMQAFMSRLKP